MALIQITDLTFAYPGSFDNVFDLNSVEDAKEKYHSSPY